jgi:uncharacterized protein (DUF342 family)
MAQLNLSTDVDAPEYADLNHKQKAFIFSKLLEYARSDKESLKKKLKTEEEKVEQLAMMVCNLMNREKSLEKELEFSKEQFGIMGRMYSLRLTESVTDKMRFKEEIEALKKELEAEKNRVN